MNMNYLALNKFPLSAISYSIIHHGSKYLNNYQVERTIGACNICNLQNVKIKKIQRFYQKLCVSNAVLVREDLRDSYDRWFAPFSREKHSNHLLIRLAFAARVIGWKISNTTLHWKCSRTRTRFQNSRWWLIKTFCDWQGMKWVLHLNGISKIKFIKWISTLQSSFLSWNQ